MVEKIKRHSAKRSRVASLKQEQAVYEANLSSWLPNHDGKHVLIKGETVDGFYDSPDDALTAGYLRFGIGPIFVKRVSAAEPVYNIPNALT